MSATLDLVDSLKSADQDFEFYPTTSRMIGAVLKDMSRDVKSILDIGAGDGRVLMAMARAHAAAKLYAIEKAPLLQQAQPDIIIPVGTEFVEQDLMSLPVDVVFCNPPYSVFEEWAARIISTVHAQALYLVLPQRWEGSALIAGAIKARGARTRVVHRDDFLEADRRARAVVHIINVTFPKAGHWNDKAQNPFDVWFDQNIGTFDQEPEIEESEQEDRALARLRDLDSITDLVAAFDEDYARMQANYQGIFKLDAALLRELGVSKESVRDGLKKRMQGLKHTYWEALFEHLDVITARLTTKTKRAFLERITGVESREDGRAGGVTAIAFTVSNAYAVVLWAIKAANQYFDAQLVDVFRQMSTHDGVSNYTSNQRTWAKDGWRYNRYHEEDLHKAPTHYKLDYRVVLEHFSAIYKGGTFGDYEYPGKLHNRAHEVIDDLIAVFGNLGFHVVTKVSANDGPVFASKLPSRRRSWVSNEWQDFENAAGETVFQVKGFLNGNLHFRFNQDAIKAMNIEAARLLGWVRGPADVVKELGYTPAEAERFFGSSQRLGAGAVKLLGSGEAAR